MKKVFIVHGFEGEPNGGWRPWLMGELAKKDTYACALAMPHPYHPVLSEWIEEIARHIDINQDDQIYLIGHSLGVPAILHYLETSKVKNIKGIVLVSGPIHSTIEILDSFKDPFDFKKIKAMIEHAVVIHGDNDPVVPVIQAHELAKELDAKVIIVKNGGHLNGSSGWTKLPQCLEALNDISLD